MRLFVLAAMLAFAVGCGVTYASNVEQYAKSHIGMHKDALRDPDKVYEHGNSTDWCYVYLFRLRPRSSPTTRPPSSTRAGTIQEKYVCVKLDQDGFVVDGWEAGVLD